MQVDFTKDGKTELVKISSKATSLLLILTTAGLLLALQSSTVLLVQSLEPILTGLIFVNLGCGLWLLLVCVEQLMPTTLKLDAAGLTRQRLITRKSFDWDDISALKLVAAGTSSDAPGTVSRGRIGIGLVLRPPNKSTARESKVVPEPTIMLIAADAQFAEKMHEIMENAQKFQAALNAKPQERWKKAAQPQQQPQFRKKPNITMPA
jgi:hypothetical protein